MMMMCSTMGMVMNRPRTVTTMAPIASSTSSVLSLLSTAQAIHEQRQQKNDVSDSISLSLDSLPYNMIRSSSSSSSTNIHNNNKSKKMTRETSDGWSQMLFDDDCSGIEDCMDVKEDEYKSRVRGVSKEMRDRLVELQSATQSEVPDMELMLQMEAARKRQKPSTPTNTVVAAAAFIDAFASHHDASPLERIAMSSIPTQLPRPVAPSKPKPRTKKSPNATAAPATATATAASTRTMARPSSSQSRSSPRALPRALQTSLPKRKSPSRTTTPMKQTNPTTTTNNSNDKTTKYTETSRVTPEQEVQLARIIQRGVKLHSLKRDFEQEHGREITKAEWTALAQLESPKELRRLVSDYRRAKNKLVTSNMGLVHTIVRDHYSSNQDKNKNNSRNGISKEEWIQEGSLGLIRAAELFDPNRGLRFSTYAYIWIKGVLSNQKLDQTIALPAREKTKWNHIQRAMIDLKHKNSEEHNTDENYVPTMEQLAKATNLDTQQVQLILSKMNKTRNLLSLDYQYQTTSRSGSDTSRAALLMNDKNLHSDADLVERLHVRADVVAALARNLDQREARLMRLRYGLQDGQTRTIVECAEAMGISRARAHQLATGCLQKLRQAEDAQSLQEYLLTIC